MLHQQTAASPATSLLARYIETTPSGEIDPSAAAFYASYDTVRSVSPDTARAIAQELADQRTNIKLIASENYCSLAVQLAHGNLLTDKYAEGSPGHRFYAGCDNVDTIESDAAETATRLFGADHAYVQPHSGADANLVAFLAILTARVEAPALERFGAKSPVTLADEDWRELRQAFINQRMLAMDYYSGGHLTHGYRFNLSSRLLEAHHYTVDPETKLLDLDAIRRQAQELRPTILLAGYSAYPRLINFAKMREIADEVGATLMVDMAHFAGLVAGKVFTGDYDPVPHAQVVTTTTHKTLRGPRGGMVLCDSEYADVVDKGCPAVLGGPLPHAMAAKAVALREATAPGFSDYAHRIVANARRLADELQRRGAQVLTGGTDNHLVMVDVANSFGLTGRQAESALRECRLTLNRNSLPFDPNGAWYTSGLRLGVPATTTLGMGGNEMTEIADIVVDVLAATSPATITNDDGTTKDSKARFDLPAEIAAAARARVDDLLSSYRLYPEIDLDIDTDTDSDERPVTA
jgi:glycine hydroxymethyltransferase